MYYEVNNKANRRLRCLGIRSRVRGCLRRRVTGAGGAKSVLGCYWLGKMCLKYPGTRWVMGRAFLKTLKETTLNSFFWVMNQQGLKSGIHYRFNAQSNIVSFPNGSEILLKDLFLYPSDPNFDELGSLEITGAFVDECNQVVEKAWNILKSRIRYRLDEYGLTPKILGTCNPSKNWVYSTFYKPDKDGTLPPNKRFIQSLLTDNPYISRHYRDNLLSLDKDSKERLLFGNWEYSDDPSQLMHIDRINDLFTNNFVPSGQKAITADIARFGNDTTTIMVWDGLRVERIVQLRKKSTSEVAQMIQHLRKMHGVVMSRVVIDEDGVGCLNDTTEVLTVDGWKLSTDIKEGDFLVSKSKENIREESIVRKVIHHESERFLMVNNRVEFTESHYHFYKTRKDHPIRGGYWDSITELSFIYHDTTVECDESIPFVNFYSTEYTMPNGGTKVLDNGFSTSRLNLSRFLGWFLSEGHLDNWNDKHVIGITQSKNSPDNDSIISCLNLLGAKWSRKKSGQGKTWVYYIQHRDLYSWLKHNCYTDINNIGCYTKKMPDYLKKCGKREFLTFCGEFIKGDGYCHKGAMQFISSSERLIDDIQEGLFMSGIKSRKHIKSESGSTSKIGDRIVTRTTNIYLLSEIFKPSALRIKNVTERYGKAINIKISNETKAILIRQGKEVFWTHNGGVVDQLQGCYGFVNNSRPVGGDNFANLKSQCYFKLAELTEQGDIYVHCPDVTMKDQLIEELEQVKQKDMDKDGKKSVIPKDKVKELIGRSPDLSDCLMMRMALEIETVPEFFVV